MFFSLLQVKKWFTVAENRLLFNQNSEVCHDVLVFCQDEEEADKIMTTAPRMFLVCKRTSDNELSFVSSKTETLLTLEDIATSFCWSVNKNLFIISKVVRTNCCHALCVFCVTTDDLGWLTFVVVSRPSPSLLFVAFITQERFDIESPNFTRTSIST